METPNWYSALNHQRCRGHDSCVVSASRLQQRWNLLSLEAGDPVLNPFLLPTSLFPSPLHVAAPQKVMSWNLRSLGHTGTQTGQVACFGSADTGFDTTYQGREGENRTGELAREPPIILQGPSDWRTGGRGVGPEWTGTGLDWLHWRMNRVLAKVCPCLFLQQKARQANVC